MQIDLPGPPPNVAMVKADVPVSNRIRMHLAVAPSGEVLGAYKLLGAAINTLTAAGHEPIIIECAYTRYKITKEENHG